MNARSMKRLNDTADRNHFVNEMARILAPYGSIRRSLLVVERDEMDAAALCFTEALCFIEMETPQQAEAAEKGLDLLLLDTRNLFFSARLRKDFVE